MFGREFWASGFVNGGTRFGEYLGALFHSLNHLPVHWGDGIVLPNRNPEVFELLLRC